MIMSKIKTAEKTAMYKDMLHCKYQLPGAFEALVKRTEHQRKHYVNTMFGYWGSEELSYKGITYEELLGETENILRRIINSWDPEKAKGKNARHTVNIAYSYIGCWLFGELRKYTAKRHGASPYYANMLVWLKKDGLDLWRSSDDSLIQRLLEQKNPPKHPEKILGKLRTKFTNPYIIQAEEMPVLQDNFSAQDAYYILTTRLKASLYYVKWMHAMMLDGIDLWEDPDAVICKWISERDPNRSFAFTFLNKMRRVFPDRERVALAFKEAKKTRALPTTVNVNKSREKAAVHYVDVEPIYAENAFNMYRATKFLAEKLKVSAYYAKMLLWFERYGESISSKDETLASILAKEAPRPNKQAERTISRLRAMTTSNLVSEAIADARKEGLVA